MTEKIISYPKNLPIDFDTMYVWHKDHSSDLYKKGMSIGMDKEQIKKYRSLLLFPRNDGVVCYRGILIIEQ